MKINYILIKILKIKKNERRNISGRPECKLARATHKPRAPESASRLWRNK